MFASLVSLVSLVPLVPIKKFHPTSFVITGEEVDAIYCKLINLGERVSLSLGCAVSRGGIRETRWGLGGETRWRTWGDKLGDLGGQDGGLGGDKMGDSGEGEARS